MKTLLMIFLCMLAHNGFAQSYIGLKASYNKTDIIGFDKQEYIAEPGYGLSVFLRHPFHPHFDFRFDLSAQERNFTRQYFDRDRIDGLTHDVFITENYTTTFLGLGTRFVFNRSGFYAGMGVDMNYLYDGLLEKTTTRLDNDDFVLFYVVSPVPLYKLTFTPSLLIGYETKPGLGLELEYMLGASQLSATDKWRNFSIIQASLVYTLKHQNYLETKNNLAPVLLTANSEAYKINRKTSQIKDITFYYEGEGNSIRIYFENRGSSSRLIRDINLFGSNGIKETDLDRFGFTNLSFPFSCRVAFRRNKDDDAVCETDFTLKSAGKWVVVIKTHDAVRSLQKGDYYIYEK